MNEWWPPWRAGQVGYLTPTGERSGGLGRNFSLQAKDLKSKGPELLFFGLGLWSEEVWLSPWLPMSPSLVPPPSNISTGMVTLLGGHLLCTVALTEAGGSSYRQDRGCPRASEGAEGESPWGADWGLLGPRWEASWRPGSFQCTGYAYMGPWHVIFYVLEMFHIKIEKNNEMKRNKQERAQRKQRAELIAL